MTIVPIDAYILLERIEIKRSVVLPDNTSPRDTSIFKVLAVGRGRVTAMGQIMELEVRVGDEVWLHPDMKLMGDTRYTPKNDKWLVDAAAVIAVVRREPGEKLACEMFEPLLVGRFADTAKKQRND